MPQETSRRRHALDGLRLGAALAVVAFHLLARDHTRWDGQLPTEALGPVAQVAAYGYAGVPVFFVLSGFVILPSAWGRGVPGFVASRIARLYPAFWAAVVFTAALRWAWPGFSSLTPGQVLANLTMVHEPFGVPSVDGVYWTLWVELQFYALVALLVHRGVTERRVLTAAVVGSVGSTVLALLVPGATDPFTLVGWFAYFALGCCLYVLVTSGPSRARLSALATTAACASALAVGRHAASVEAVVTGVEISRLTYLAVVLGGVGLVAIAAVLRLPRRAALACTAAGALTYPLYLTHEYLGWAVLDALSPHVPAVLTVVVALAVSLVVAFALQRGVEIPVAGRLRHGVLRVLGGSGTAGAPTPGPAPSRAPSMPLATLQPSGPAPEPIPVHRGLRLL